MPWIPSPIDSIANILVVGVGRMGQNHLRVISELDGARIAGLVDTDIDHARGISEGYGVPAYNSVTDALTDGVFDAACVVTPAISHAESSIPLIERGIPVLIEKPLAIDSKTSEQISEVAKSNGTPCLVGHIERFNPVVTAAKKVIDSGTIGDIHHITSRRVGPVPPINPDCGVLLDLATHEFDIVSELVGEFPTDAYCAATCTSNTPFEDIATITLGFGKPIIASVEVNWLSPVKQREARIIGSKGALHIDYIEQTAVLETARLDRLQSASPTILPIDTKIPVDRVEPLAMEIRNLIDVARGEEEQTVSLEDGIMAVRIAEKCAESYETATRVKI